MTNKQGLIIVGAGGHAKVVLSVALLNSEKIAGYLDDNPSLLNKFIGEYPVIGNTSALASGFESAVVGLGDNLKRKTIVERYIFATKWKTLVHPTAYVHPSVILGKGTVVFAGAIIQPDVVIGEHCIINTGATIDHDCVLGSYTHIAPGVHLAGGVKVGEGSFLGIGSVVIPEINIGDWAQVAAGGVVINPIPAKKIVMGVPARERTICPQ